jgi:hypothetical protein
MAKRGTFPIPALASRANNELQRHPLGAFYTMGSAMSLYAKALRLIASTILVEIEPNWR